MLVMPFGTGGGTTELLGISPRTILWMMKLVMLTWTSYCTYPLAILQFGCAMATGVTHLPHGFGFTASLRRSGMRRLGLGCTRDHGHYSTA